MIRIVRASVKAASPGGRTWDYFRDERHWEAPMRSVFSWITPSIARDAEAARCHATVLLLTLGERYKAIWRDTRITFPVFYDAMYQNVDRRGWWSSAPPSLFGSGPDEAAEIAEVVKDTLTAFQKGGDHRNYSLLTKWLHFCFPDTFAIYDSYAGTSIQAAMACIGAGQKPAPYDRRQFESIRIADSSGSGYVGLLNFYRLFWEEAVASGLDGDLLKTAAAAEEMVRAEPGGQAARVTPLDILDKLLWKAKGSVNELGIGRP